MKKNILIITLSVLFLCSCNNENYELTESIPGIEGTWKWHSTVVGGFVGIFNTSHYDLDCTLIFEKDNLMSIMDGDEYVIYQEEFKVGKAKDDSVGDYQIELPQKVKKAVKEHFTDYEIYVDGYISISTDGDFPMLNIKSIEKEDIEHNIGSHYVR